MPFYPLIHLVSWMFSMWKSKSRLQMFQWCKLLTFVFSTFVFSQFFYARVWSGHRLTAKVFLIVWLCERGCILCVCVCVWWFNFFSLLLIWILWVLFHIKAKLEINLLVNKHQGGEVLWQGKNFLCQRWMKDLLIQQGFHF